MNENQILSNSVCTRYYQIGVHYFKLNMPINMNFPENLSKFEITSDDLQTISHVIPYTEYTFDFTEDMEEVVNNVKKKQVSGRIIKRDNLLVFPTTTGECRLISHFFASLPYAISYQESEFCYHVWVDQQENEFLSCDPAFIALLSLERHMIRDHAMILHSAYIVYKGKAILFSAPSETGKSTQASLWETYRQTRTINGDRSLLYKHEDNLWYAHGWPVCGSSEICYNEAYPIHAIVMLKQAKENCAYPLKGATAFSEIMSQITINTWNTEFHLQVLDHIERLIQEVPVYRLECNISEHAVECLEKMIHL